MTVAFRLSTNGIAVAVGVRVGGIGVDVTVGNGVGVADGSAVGGANVEVTAAGARVGTEAGEQAVSMKIRMKPVAINFFMRIILNPFSIP